ncbi:MAG: c-type cytochrome, partial [Candidatus Saccharimonadales bacterium]
LDDAEPNNRARALWLLDRIGGDARNLVTDQLQSSDAAMRALAVRILRRHGDEYAESILALAGDSSGEVRRDVLLAFPKLSGLKAEAALVKLASAYDGNDRYQLEAINIAAGKRKAELYAALESAGKASLDKIQLLQLLDAKRAADLLAHSLAATNLDDAARATLVKQLGGSTSSEAGMAVVKLMGDDRTARDLRALSLNLLASNLSGAWKPLRDRPELAVAVRKLLGEAEWQLAALRLVGDDHLVQFGADVLALAANDKASVEARQKAIEVAAALRVETASPTLEKLLHSNEATLRQAALAALIELQDWPAVKQVLSSPATPADVKQRIVDRLIDSGAGALVLLRWIDAKLLSDALRGQAIAKAALHPDSNIRVLYEKFIPAEQRPKRLGAAIKPADILALKGDARRGEQIFSQSTAAQCKSCHRVGDVGGAIGPDLSQIGKKYERATLLETILDPSKAIAPEYVPYLVETEQGQVYVGFVVEKNDERMVLKDAKGQLIH